MTDIMKNFLADLRGLLERYNASFSDYENYQVAFLIDREKGVDCEVAYFKIREMAGNEYCINKENFYDCLEVL